MKDDGPGSRKRWPVRKVAFGTLVAALAASVGLKGMPVGSAASEGLTSPRTIRLWAQATKGGTVDLGEPGPGVGDELIISGFLSTATFPHTKVGTFSKVCTQTNDGGRALCSTVLKLSHEGTITTEGLAGGGGTDPAVAAVTGGTGAFENAGGQVEEKVRSAALSVLVLRLTA
jgi:hypothetical protein